MGSAEIEAPRRHQHACLSCVRLHPEAEKLHSAPSSRRQLHRQRLHDWDRASKPFVSTEKLDQLNQYGATGSGRTRQTPGEVEDTAERRHRRHTVASGLHLGLINDPMKPNLKPARAQPQLGANAMQLHEPARKQAHGAVLNTVKRPEQPAARTLDSCFIKRSTSRMAARNCVEKPMSIDRRDVSGSFLCDFTGAEPVMTVLDEPQEMKQLTGRAKCSKNVPPVQVTRGRRFSVDDRCKSAVPPVSSRHVGAIDTELALVQPRYDFAVKKVKKQSHQPKTLESDSSADKSTSKKHHAQLIDCLTVNRRPGDRRHTMTGASTKNLIPRHRHWNRVDVIDEVGSREHDRPKYKVGLADFHLSTFKLMPPESTLGQQSTSNVARYESRSKNGKHEMAKPVVAAREVRGSSRSKNELCDLAYLDVFKTYTL
uniref:Uncharacterized protein n=1 Tax=Hyaloperonospora arabidopsidis (strain Emoy2) TaxID=559515 RepID=M4B5Z4_HYAAE